MAKTGDTAIRRPVTGSRLVLFLAWACALPATAGAQTLPVPEAQQSDAATDAPAAADDEPAKPDSAETADTSASDDAPEPEAGQQGVAAAPFDPDAPADQAFRLGPGWTAGARFDLDLEWTNNRDLDSPNDDHEILLEPRFTLSSLYRPNERVEFFFEARMTYDIFLVGDESDPELRGLYAYVEDFPIRRLDLQVGRQRIDDDREWLFDERLDALRFLYERGRYSLDLSVSSELIDPDDPSERTVNFIAYNTFRYADHNRLSVYSVVRSTRADDRDDDADRAWTGIYWRGRPADDHRAWLQAALLTGREDEDGLFAYGIDAGYTVRFDDYDLRPNATLAFAYGSGDGNSDDDLDGDFQQTGLQDNEARFWGNTKFKYYGEALDPELSNLVILTLGAGIAPSKRTSLDLVYHYYYQAEPDDDLGSSDINEDPTGNSHDLGHGLDLILGHRLTDKIRASVTTGVFLPGSAFEEHDPAPKIALELQVNF